MRTPLKTGSIDHVHLRKYNKNSRVLLLNFMSVKSAGEVNNFVQNMITLRFVYVRSSTNFRPVEMTVFVKLIVE